MIGRNAGHRRGGGRAGLLGGAGGCGRRRSFCNAAPTAAAEAVLRGLRWNHSQGRNPKPHWFTTIADEPRDGTVRDEVRALSVAAQSSLPPAVAGWSAET